MTTWDPGWSLDEPTMAIVLGLVSPTTRLVLEAGSGRSTVEIAKALAPHGGRVIALEEWEPYAEQTRAALQESSSDNATVHVTRLGPTQHGIWYRNLPKLEFRSVDLVVIDGPRSDGLDERSASLFVLDPYLSPDCVVVIDDAKRHGDNRALQIWERIGWTVEHIDTERGCAILRGKPE